MVEDGKVKRCIPPILFKLLSPKALPSICIIKDLPQARERKFPL